MTYRTRNTVSFFLFHFRWSQGYDGDSAEFITNDTLCYKCGNNVKFVKEDGSERVYATDGNRCLAVHGINNVFAFADQQLSPVVHIMSYPSLETIQQLKGTLWVQGCLRRWFALKSSIKESCCIHCVCSTKPDQLSEGLPVKSKLSLFLQMVPKWSTCACVSRRVISSPLWQEFLTISLSFGLLQFHSIVHSPWTCWNAGSFHLQVAFSSFLPKTMRKLPLQELHGWNQVVQHWHIWHCSDLFNFQSSQLEANSLLLSHRTDTVEHRSLRHYFPHQEKVGQNACLTFTVQLLVNHGSFSSPSFLVGLVGRDDCVLGH